MFGSASVKDEPSDTPDAPQTSSTGHNPHSSLDPKGTYSLQPDGSPFSSSSSSFAPYANLQTHMQAGNMPSTNTGKQLMLFGRSLSNSPQTIQPPLLKSPEGFTEWKKKFSLALRLSNLHSFIEHNSVVNWDKAVKTNHTGLSEGVLRGVFLDLNALTVTVLMIAVDLVIPDFSLVEDSIRQDGQSGHGMYTCHEDIQPYEDAFTLWNKIVSKYEQKTTYSIADAYRSFHSYKIRANSIDYVGYQNEINRRITECNKALLHDKPLPGHVFGSSTRQ